MVACASWVPAECKYPVVSRGQVNHFPEDTPVSPGPASSYEHSTADRFIETVPAFTPTEEEFADPVHAAASCAAASSATSVAAASASSDCLLLPPLYSLLSVLLCCCVLMCCRWPIWSPCTPRLLPRACCSSHRLLRGARYAHVLQDAHELQAREAEAVDPAQFFFSKVPSLLPFCWPHCPALCPV
eukprot:GHVR01189929.1.p1 GENE.GHVR01189929.1~~GHVR01189929.1.p1  ORF type:complete len:186 (+),score=41.07 GHVR01189929.1:565-1122(+)